MDGILPFCNLSEEDFAFHCFESNNITINTSSEQLKAIYNELKQTNMFYKHLFDKDETNDKQYTDQTSHNICGLWLSIRREEGKSLSS